MGKMQAFAKDHSFTEYREKFGSKALNEEDIYDTKILRSVGAPGDTWTWKAGTDKEQSFDFAPFFPIDNDGTPPYYRMRSRVDRHEAGLFFEYREDGGNGDFEPIPPPTPERLKKLMEGATGDIP